VIVQGLEMLKGLGVVWRDGSLNAEIPVLPNRPDMAKLAEEVEALLMDGVTLPVLLVAGHGLTAWGHTIEQARDHLEAAEFVCQVLWEEWRQIDRRGC
jgi:methylthioribose-1-phosphate isomerase